MEIPACNVLGGQVRMPRVQIGINVTSSKDATYSLSSVNLPSKASPKSRVVSQLGTQEFEGDLPSSAVLGQEHDPHASGADTAQDAIGTDDPRVRLMEALHG